jgi:hypothetical protein
VRLGRIEVNDKNDRVGVIGCGLDACEEMFVACLDESNVLKLLQRGVRLARGSPDEVPDSAGGSPAQ